MATDTEEIRGIGHNVRRVEDDRFIQGKGNYIDDMKLPGMLFGDLCTAVTRAWA